MIIWIFLSGFAPLIGAFISFLLSSLTSSSSSSSSSSSFGPSRAVLVKAIMLGVSAGVLLAIATHELIPEALSIVSGLEVPGKSEHTHNDEDPHQEHHSGEEEGEEGFLEYMGPSKQVFKLGIKTVMEGVALGFISVILVERLSEWSGQGGGHGHSHGLPMSSKEEEKARKHDGKSAGSGLSLAAISGLLLHSAVDGVIMAGGFRVSSEVGARVAGAVVMHKIPDGFVLASILNWTHNSGSSSSGGGREGGVEDPLTSPSGAQLPSSPGPPPPLPPSSPSSPFLCFSHPLLCVLIQSSLTPLGMLLSSWFLSEVTPFTLAFLLAFGGGTFLCITSVGVLAPLLHLHAPIPTVATVSAVLGYFGYIVLDGAVHVH